MYILKFRPITDFARKCVRENPQNYPQDKDGWTLVFANVKEKKVKEYETEEAAKRHASFWQGDWEWKIIKVKEWSKE